MNNLLVIYCSVHLHSRVISDFCVLSFCLILCLLRFGMQFILRNPPPPPFQINFTVLWNFPPTLSFAAVCDVTETLRGQRPCRLFGTNSNTGTWNRLVKKYCFRWNGKTTTTTLAHFMRLKWLSKQQVWPKNKHRREVKWGNNFRGNSVKLIERKLGLFFFLPPASEHLTDTREVALIVFFFMLYVAWKRGLPRKFARFFLFRPIKKRSFNLVCDLDLFFRTLTVNSVSD